MFVGALEKDDDSNWCPGGPLVQRIHDWLADQGYTVHELQSVGSYWRFDCERGKRSERITDRLMVQFASNVDDQPDKHLLQIADSHASSPGVISRMLGAREERSASPKAIHELALVIHEYLGGLDAMSDFRWCWDGYPDDTDWTQEPMGPAEQSTD